MDDPTDKAEGALGASRPEDSKRRLDASSDSSSDSSTAPDDSPDHAMDDAPDRHGDSDTGRGDDLSGAVRQRLEALIPEMVKKTFAAGMGAVFTTEEGIRRLTKDLSLPKDVAGYLANTAGNTKDELVRIVAGEVREFLQTVNLSEEIAKMLTTLSFEIKTEIRFIPNDEKYAGVQPDVNARVRLKRAEDRPRRRRRRRRDDGDGDQAADDPDEQAED